MDIYLCVTLLLLGPGLGACYECSDSGSPITATTEPQFLTSPWFPQQYPNSYQCCVLITTEIPGHVLHVEVVHMQLSLWNDTCLDNVIICDGNCTDNPVLHTWCGSSHAAVSTSGGSLYLVFTSDEQISDQGFVFRFWSQTPVNTSCVGGGSRYLRVADTPVYLSLSHYRHSPYICVYYLWSEDDDSSVTLSIHTWNITSGNWGKLDIYDGPSTSSFLLLSWFHGNQPFSRLTSSGRNLTIVHTYHGTSANSLNIRATATNRNVKSSCDRDSPTVEEVTSLPSIFWYPAQWAPNGLPCPMKIISRISSKTLMVDVIGDFSTDLEHLNVTEGTIDGNPVAASLMDNITTYRSTEQVLYINTNTSLEHAVPLRVLAIDNIFNGEVILKQALPSSVSMDIEMTTIPSNAYIVYNISADHQTNVVQLELPGKLFSDKAFTRTCKGDWINFYQGSNHQYWCPGSNGSVVKRSSKSYLSFVLRTHDVPWNGYFRGKYFSLNARSMCAPGIVLTPASKTLTQTITSPFHPWPYSVNNTCTWLIYAPQINYVVIVNVTKSDLPPDCSDLVYVIDGWKLTHKTIGRICGTDRTSFRSSTPYLLLRFTSNSVGNRESGFKIEYSAEHKTGGKRMKGGPPVGIIAGACIALVVVGGIIYVIVHENRKRHKLAKSKREELI